MFLSAVDYFENHYYHWNRRFLSIIGLWPEQNKKEQVFRICTVTIFQISLLMQQLCQLCTSSFEMEWIINAVQLLLPIACSLCGYYTITFNFIKVRMLHFRMKFDYEQISDKKEFTTVKKYADQSKWCTLIITFFLYSYGILLTSPSILNVVLYFFGLLDDTQLTLPIPIGHILNAGLLYYAILFYEAIVIFIVTTAALASYATYILLVQHACSQFSIIKMKINQPFEQNNSDIFAWYDSAPQYQYTWIVDIIKRYKRVTELIDLTNSLTEKIYLVEMFLGLFLIIVDFLYLFQMTAVQWMLQLEFKVDSIIKPLYSLIPALCVMVGYYTGLFNSTTAY
ncbi:hypothetical protein KPH14_006110 [Odynerus spinipes]|uniref:Odorant receptor n=1 Tax=Odynerus spinipes TaxID=1348599 RepID=A0AAD9RK35_9HYME|nr:hypothetical protein KPH14_006110 [Odynerus spinipes]